METPDTVTRLLADCRRGDERALEQLLPLVYDELRRLAGRFLDRERSDHTLQATALVHEAYLKLVDQRQRDWNDRRHFLCIAATAMRRVLVNHALARRAEKRGGGRRRVTLFGAPTVFEERAEDLAALDGALERMARLDPTRCRLVELRFFAGLSVEETARVLELSPRTVERGWRAARAWLRKEIEET
jgi:RNA polymerase sigma factor (TIGR02999 family)